jgi:hypothetical protein
MKKVFLFAASAVILALTGCNEQQPDSYPDDVYIYNNKTSVTVTLEGYQGDVLKESWTIEPGKALKEVVPASTTTRNTYGGKQDYQISGTTAISNYEIIRVVFGDTREMWFKASEPNTLYNIYNVLNYTFGASNATERELIYEIDEDMMNNATEIKK